MVVAPLSMFALMLIHAVLGPAEAANRIVQSAALPTNIYDPKVQGDEEPFAGYASECGFRIVLRSTRHVSLAETEEDGTPYIVIDPLLTKPGNEHHKVFLIAHECAHHRLGHTSKGGLQFRMSSRRAVADQELSADCLASEMLSDAGLDTSTNMMSIRMSRLGIFSPGGGYPPGVQRAKIIQSCAEVASRRQLVRGDLVSTVK